MATLLMLTVYAAVSALATLGARWIGEHWEPQVHG